VLNLNLVRDDHQPAPASDLVKRDLLAVEGSGSPPEDYSSRHGLDPQLAQVTAVLSSDLGR
jgi:hypothetical protein